MKVSLSLCFKLFVLFQVIEIILASTTNDLEKEEFRKFKIKYNKKYSSPVAELQAFKQFVKFFRIINKHNKEFAQDKHTFDMAINQLADLSDAQLADYVTGNQLPPYEFGNFTVRPKNVVNVQPGDLPPGPAAIDWKQLGHVTPVKDQGFYCNSCWAFSAVAAFESHLSIKYGKLQSGSEQALIDCNRNAETGNFGCKGGSQASSYMYMLYAPGLPSMESYPYQENVENSTPLPCRYIKSTSIGTTTGYARLPPLDEVLLKNVVGNLGPVAFAMNASPTSFLFYASGIYSDPLCTPSLQHSAIAYGYGTAKFKNGTTIDFWLCKNSWSDTWGDKGYFKMIRGKNMCGMANYMIYPLV